METGLFIGLAIIGLLMVGSIWLVAYMAEKPYPRKKNEP